MAALNVLSLVLTQVGAGREAVVYSRRALSHEPLDPDLLVAHGVALDVDGRPGDATAQYVQALGADPQHVHALNNLAALRLQCGDLDRAASLLTRALVYDPRLSEARANIDVVAGLARSVLISRLGLVMALACGLAYAQVPGAWLLAVIGGVWAGVGLWRLPAPVRGRLGRDIDWRDIAVLVLILVTAPVAFGGDPSGSALPFIAWIVIFGVAVIGRLVWRRVAVAIRLRRLGVRLRGV
jgi:tetratricopeptide (TPR) repeat protein